MGRYQRRFSFEVKEGRLEKPGGKIRSSWTYEDNYFGERRITIFN